jgi:TolB-like protein/Flp pilus assembly protein TadD
MPHDVFISYEHSDAAICTKLEQEGIGCWIAPRDIPPGGDFTSEINQAISNTKILILVFTTPANASPYVVREIERAVKGSKKIIPFRLENIQPSSSLEFLLSMSQWQDAFPPPLEPHIETLAREVKNRLAELSSGRDSFINRHGAAPEPALSSSNFLRWISRNRLLASILAIALAILIGVLLFHPWRHPGKVSIAVLPFELQSADAQSAYIAEGIAEELIYELHPIPGCVAISRNSSFAIKASKLPDSTTARKLNVRYLVKGTLRISNSTFDISAELYDRLTNEHTAIGNYVSDRNQLLATQRSMLEDICGAVGLPADRAAQCGISPEPYLTFLQGLYHLGNVGTKAQFAIIDFREVLAKDTGSSRVKIFLARALISLANSNQDAVLLTEAEGLLLSVITRKPDEPDALGLLGEIKMFQGNYSAAEELVNKSLRIDPNNIFALTASGSIYFRTDPARAIQRFLVVKEIEPYSVIANSNLAAAYAKLKEFGEAVRYIRYSLDLDSTNTFALSNLASLYMVQEKYDSAAIYYRTLVKYDPKSASNYFLLTSVLLLEKRIPEAKALLADADRLIPSNYEISYLWGATFIAAKQDVAAKEKFREGLALLDQAKPDTGSFVQTAFRALFCAHLGKQAEDRKIISEIESANDSNLAVTKLIIQTCAVMGDKKAVLQWLKKGRVISPEDIDITYLRTEIDLGAFRNDHDIEMAVRELQTP